MADSAKSPSARRTRRAPPLPVLLVKAGCLFGFWLLLSGKYNVFHIGVGALSVACVLWLDSRLAPVGAGDPSRIHPLRFVFYYLWLMREMVVSAVYVARAILRPEKYIEPRMVCFHCKQPGIVASVVLANSITLTPGTLTVDLEDDHYLVHALTPRTANDLLSGAMQARVARLFDDGQAPATTQVDSEIARRAMSDSS